MIESLSIFEVEYIAFKLARELMTFNEPIPDFGTRFPNTLESCLVVPFQTFERKSLYKSFLDKAAILFYLLIKNHPFQNGNKRIAMTVLFVFLHKNKKWLKVDDRELYNFAVWVAESPSKLKTETVLAIRKFLETYLVNLN
ncbi:MAG: type II toxin-antitoxin system death-on-curing family toxin [Candidatus Parcubacteria bacterium]|nr:type II toxin-antitoxin system death-on-curing family toxin [Candidatus Parcubacteria bacterium]